VLEEVLQGLVEGVHGREGGRVPEGRVLTSGDDMSLRAVPPARRWWAGGTTRSWRARQG
jgi:hypothetical protein